MKGIAHFATGLCLASFVPGALDPGSLLIPLGGACGMLPDTLDFRIERFIERRDADIAPDLFGDDPQAMAEAAARHIRLVAQDGRPRRVQFHPTRRGLIDWVLYSVQFDAARGDVVIAFDDGRTGRAPAGKLAYGYDGGIHIETLGGPSFKFERAGASGAGLIEVEFLPWHRARTHSLLLALAVGVACAVMFGVPAGIAGGVGYAAHVLEDQLGYMGSNLWWPLTRGRSTGLRVLHAADPPANLAAVWLSLSLLMLNMDRAAPLPLIDAGPYLAFVVALPFALLAGLQARKVRDRHARSAASERGRELVGETKEADG